MIPTLGERGPPTGRVPRWAPLPGESAAVDDGRRTLQDWLVDAALFGVAVLAWLWGWHELVGDPDPGYRAALSDWMVTIEPWVGALACVAVWWRRRFPLALAIAMIPALTVSGAALGAVLVSVFTAAVHRSWLPATLVAAVQLGQGVAFSFMWHPPDMTQRAYVVFMVFMFLTPLACGMAVRFRRQVLRRDARRQWEEHAQRLAQARRAERERIAREMHDVLAHRISLLSVHAGALAYRTFQAEAGRGTPPAASEVGEAVRVIRDNANQALSELGEVLSVLRAEQPEAAEPDGRGAPQPLLHDLPRLVDEARAAGQRVTLAIDCTELPPLRPQEQRTAYRVVQEGLTNARKHAPDAQVAVRVDGTNGAGLDVTVSNPLPVGVTAVEIPGAGAGLSGLAERVALDGGTLEHGAVDGAFQLAAHLPCRD